MYVIVTQSKISDRISDLNQRDLLQNIHAVHVTVDCMVGSQEFTNTDSAIRFNAACWRGHVTALCNYGIQMCEAYQRVPQNSLGNRGLVQAISWELDYASQGEEQDTLSHGMLQPEWTTNLDVLYAHRRYLQTSDASYNKKWPELVNWPALYVPVLPSGVHAYSAA